MDENDFKLGLHDYDGQTVLNPLGLLAIVVLGLAMLLVPRRYAVWPMIIMSCFVAPAQRIAIFTLNFDLLRILVIFGTVRILARNEWKGFVWRGMDSVLVAFAVVGAVVYILQYGTPEAAKVKLGVMYDILGMYFLFRCLVRDMNDLARVAFGFAMISLPVALAFLLERVTGRNMFAAFGGVPVVTVIRDGRLRCQGAFAHPILAGCYWASVLPLMAALWWRQGAPRWWGVIGLVCGLVIIVLCASSTPVSGVAFGLLGGIFFALRRHMRIVRWLILGTLFCLHMTMQAPVWHLISRFDLAGGSTGWYRYNVINQFVIHVNEWWLLGFRNVGNWGLVNGDIPNQYFLESARGGIWALTLLVILIVLAFSGVGRLWRREARHKSNLILSWALGVSLLIHCVNFIGIGYFGQINMVWYLTLALVASLSSSRPRARATKTASAAIPRAALNAERCIGV